MAHQAAKDMADKFIGEPKEEKYSRYILYTEPVTRTNVYYAAAFDHYDLIIPRGELSYIVGMMPWSLSRLAFHGIEKDGGIFVEFLQKGPWSKCTTEMFGDVIIFEDVHPKKIDNFEACERIDRYVDEMREIMKDAINATKKENSKKKPKT